MIRFLLVSFLVAGVAPASTNVLPLAGTWNIRLQPDGPAGTIYLPGSTDQGGYGTRTSGPEKGWLSRPYTYEGKAWYEKTVTIPESWRGQRVTLYLERPHWQSEVSLDGKPAGTRDSLATPHVYDLGSPAPGTHRLTICIDNTYRIEVGRNAHSVTEHTQTNWNGIVGRMELRAGGSTWIDAVRLIRAGQSLNVEVDVGGGGSGEVTGRVRGRSYTARAAAGRASFTVPLEGVRLWDEYQGALDQLDLKLAAPGATDERSVRFGVRDIATRGTQFLLNGRPIFLRGTLECNIFPKTGYPPMREEEWDRLFRIARQYGLNSFRFHSWCPPEAAFAAADRAGFLLHVELPVWSNQVGKNEALNQFMRAEARRMLAEYGNHPSFTMLCLGNELTGDFAWMDRLTAELKTLDPRRLYTFSADHVRRQPGPTSDYWVTHHARTGPVRIHGARFAGSMDGTSFDFSAHLAENRLPLVAHELGQWVTFPGYDEISKYTGVLKPRNLEAFREQLAARGMADQARDFQAATGAFAWRLYREDMEAALRTPGFGGFQLLQLQDFPGQGEALVGLLDSFWESKGIFTPEQFRQSCDRTVALLRFGKFAWTNDETFTATAQVAHYGTASLNGVSAQWTAVDESGQKLGGGTLQPASVPLGSVTTLGSISLPLAQVTRARRVNVSLEMAGVHNQWDIWVYPARLPAAPASVLVTASAEAARDRLNQGGRVLLLAAPKELPIRFLPVFWSLTWFPKQPGVLGVLCDPNHPALASFPTAAGTDFQWWDVLEGSRAIVLDDAPVTLRPLVQVIDDYHRNHRLGAVMEARVGEGALILTSLDLERGLEKRPAARQLRHSLVEYAAGDRFRPAAQLSFEALEKLLR